MKQDSLPEGIALSFFSKSFYQRVGSQWKAKSAAYLAIVVVACSIPAMVQVKANISTTLHHMREVFLAKIPTLEIVKGEVKASVNTPYEIRFTDGAKEFFLIDLTGQMTSLSQTNATVLLTKNKLLVRKTAAEISEYDLSKVDHFLLNPTRLSRWFDWVQKWVPRLAMMVIVLFSFITRFVEALLLAIVGTLLVHWVGTRLQFSQLVTLSIVSMTPALVWNAVMFSHPGRLKEIMSLWLTVSYFVFAINSATDTPMDEPEA